LDKITRLISWDLVNFGVVLVEALVLKIGMKGVELASSIQIGDAHWDHAAA
jgi:hypothetical protein